MIAIQIKQFLKFFFGPTEELFVHACMFYRLKKARYGFSNHGPITVGQFSKTSNLPWLLFFLSFFFFQVLYCIHIILLKVSSY